MLSPQDCAICVNIIYYIIYPDYIFVKYLLIKIYIIHPKGDEIKEKHNQMHKNSHGSPQGHSMIKSLLLR